MEHRTSTLDVVCDGFIDANFYILKPVVHLRKSKRAAFGREGLKQILSALRRPWTMNPEVFRQFGQSLAKAGSAQDEAHAVKPPIANV